LGIDVSDHAALDMGSVRQFSPVLLPFTCTTTTTSVIAPTNK
jgi:hypothetical protein